MGHRYNIPQPLTSLSLPNLHVHLEAKVGRTCVNINKASPQLKSYLHFCPGLSLFVDSLIEPLQRIAVITACLGEMESLN